MFGFGMWEIAIFIGLLVVLFGARRAGRIVRRGMDLPFAQKRWCGNADIDKVKTLSDYQERSFGENFGLLIKELKLLARAVFVIDAAGQIAYREIVPEVTDEPD
ncbi:MAG TPA: hypothetical protein ENN94_00930, partial [Geoalkalibacter subterraneus]|nr:hypothetical protein [Geoalkalibacter subterraneus]